MGELTACINIAMDNFSTEPKYGNSLSNHGGWVVSVVTWQIFKDSHPLPTKFQISLGTQSIYHYREYFRNNAFSYDLCNGRFNRAGRAEIGALVVPLIPDFHYINYQTQRVEGEVSPLA